MAARIPEQFEPRDRKLKDKVKATVINPADAARLLQFVWEHREDDYKFSYACMIFHILFYFGFRRSEILGLKKSQINIAQGYVDIQGLGIVKTMFIELKQKMMVLKDWFILILLESS